MARKYQQGFEARGLDLLSRSAGTGTIAITNAAAYLGIGYGLQLVGASSSGEALAEITIPAHAWSDEVYIRQMIDMNSNHLGDLLQIRAESANNIVSMDLESGDIDIIGGLEGNIGATSPGFKRWEFYIKCANSGGVVTIRIDDVEVFTYSGDTQPAATTDVVELAWRAVSSSSRIYIDDIAYNDTVDDGRGNDIWPGAGKIYGFRANIQGPFRAWDKFPDTGEENWEDVDDGVPDDDSTYVQSGTLGQRDAHGTENIPAGSFNIRPGCVQWSVDAKLVGGGSGEISSYMVKDGVPLEGNSRAPGAFYGYIYDMLLTDPDGNEWLRDDFDNTQFGYKAT
ncbi:hypothetical protein LCGC14_0275170 [marine sediment metagenome]|uniref:Uncharacterized protein n=1 Tax=marine sediment metagenome TaxID=412755 RepID=A0A0F9UEB0_9ZZZZ